MELVIDDFGAFVGKKGNRFEVRRKEGTEECSADKVSQILICSASAISTDAVKLATENGIDIAFLSHYGKPFARIYPCKLGGTTLTRRRQATKYLTEGVAEMVKGMIRAKITNQVNLLRLISKTREGVDFSSEIDWIVAQLGKLDGITGNVEDARERILGIEGYSSSVYWSCLSKVFPFTERQHEAKDSFNAMLNYGYGILYSEIEKACIVAGLDPYLGFLHTDRYGKPSTVLDLIEEFRQPIVDRAVTTLFARKQVEDGDFETSGNVFMLSQKGRRKVVEAVMERLHSKTKFGGREISLQGVMLEQARRVAKVLLGESPGYEGFVYRW